MFFVTFFNSPLYIYTQLDGEDSRSGPITCLRETAAGCFYAQILDALLPGKVRMDGVVWGKHGSVLEHEVTNNFKARTKKKTA